MVTPNNTRAAKNYIFRIRVSKNAFNSILKTVSLACGKLYSTVAGFAGVPGCGGGSSSSLDVLVATLQTDELQANVHQSIEREKYLM